MKTLLTAVVIALTLLMGCRPSITEEEPPDYKSYYQVDTGKPVGMILSAYKTTMLANGMDETKLRVTVSDSTGKEISSANLPFQVMITGDAKILAVEGSPEFGPGIEMDDTTTWNSRVQDGICWLILRTGITPGKFKVEVSADSLWSASHEIHTLPGNTELQSPSAEQIISIEKEIPGMIGADISFLPQLESRGRKFYEDGEEKDVMYLLRDHGFNYIRLRLFVNPENEKGYSPELGFCGLDSTLRMARRASEAGMDLLLNFHYSDYWADPQQQNMPQAWSELDFEGLRMTLKEYTSSVITALRDQGTLPAMVQIGNEINHGLLWPDGHISNLDNLAELLKAGVAGVREVDPDIVVMMHIALGGQNEEAVFWLDNMIARGVEFDILGLSYYPRWHGTLDDLYFNLVDLTDRYKKDVNVVEYSQYKRELHDMVFTLPNGRGKGTCIWEPLNTWSRVFDREGNVTSDIQVYDEMNKKYLGTK
jgi:beta-galactosidase